MKATRIFSAILFAAITLISFSGKAQSYGAPKLPEFVFQTMDGRPFTQKEVTKTKTSIFVLFDVTCEHCMHEIESISKSYNSFKDVEFYLVSMDNKTAIINFLNIHGKGLYGKPNITVLQDFKPEFVQKFRPEKFPALFIYSKSGDLIKYMSGQKTASDILKALKK